MCESSEALNENKKSAACVIYRIAHEHSLKHITYHFKIEDSTIR